MADNLELNFRKAMQAGFRVLGWRDPGYIKPVYVKKSRPLKRPPGRPRVPKHAAESKYYVLRYHPKPWKAIPLVGSRSPAEELLLRCHNERFGYERTHPVIVKDFIRELFPKEQGPMIEMLDRWREYGAARLEAMVRRSTNGHVARDPRLALFKDTGEMMMSADEMREMWKTGFPDAGKSRDRFEKHLRSLRVAGLVDEVWLRRVEPPGGLLEDVFYEEGPRKRGQPYKPAGYSYYGYYDDKLTSLPK